MSRNHVLHQLDLTHRRAISDPSSIDTILNYRKSENGDYTKSRMIFFDFENIFELIIEMIDF